MDRRTFLGTAGAAAAGVALAPSGRTKPKPPTVPDDQVVYVDLRVVDAKLDKGLWTYTLAEQVTSGRSNAVLVVKGGGQSVWQPGDLILGTFYRYTEPDPSLSERAARSRATEP